MIFADFRVYQIGCFGKPDKRLCHLFLQILQTRYLNSPSSRSTTGCGSAWRYGRCSKSGCSGV